MPKQKAEHLGRLEVRLPKAMLYALKWTAEHDRLPLSDWVRKALNENCYSVSRHDGARPPYEVLMQGMWKKGAGLVDSRPLKPGTNKWIGERQNKTKNIRVYTDIDGNEHFGQLPDEPGEQMKQDMMMDREQARRELRTWKNKWGRELKTNVLTDKQARLLDRLLATFDSDPV